MIVYVESNFVLEIALEQEQSAEARAILALAQNNKIILAFSSFALGETFECIMRENRERNKILTSLVRTLQNLQRSESHKRIMIDLEPTLNVLSEAHARQIDLLHATIDQLLYAGRTIEVTSSNFKSALQYQKSLDLSPQDSIIYSSVVSDMNVRAKEEIKCFLSRDKRAFDSDNDTNIKDELSLYNCRYIGSFKQGLDYIQHIIKQQIE